MLGDRSGKIGTSLREELEREEQRTNRWLPDGRGVGGMDKKGKRD